MNVFPRKGRRALAQAGPCSWIWAEEVKYVFKIKVAEVPAMKALTKDSAVERRTEARAVGEGEDEEGILRIEVQ